MELQSQVSDLMTDEKERQVLGINHCQVDGIAQTALGKKHP